MRITTALILEPCDLTKDGNLKKEAFAAMCQHDVVLSSGTVFKCSSPFDSKPKDAPPKRTRKLKVQTVIDVGPVAEPAKPITPGMAIIR